MNDKQAAEAVIRWVTQAYVDAVYQHTKANAEFQGNHTAGETWHSCDPDSCIGTNPYTHKTKRLSEVCDSTLRAQLDWKHVHDFVIRRICNLLEKS